MMYEVNARMGDVVIEGISEWHGLLCENEK